MIKFSSYTATLKISKHEFDRALPLCMMLRHQQDTRDRLREREDANMLASISAFQRRKVERAQLREQSRALFERAEAELATLTTQPARERLVNRVRADAEKIIARDRELDEFDRQFWLPTRAPASSARLRTASRTRHPTR